MKFDQVIDAISLVLDWISEFSFAPGFNGGDAATPLGHCFGDMLDAYIDPFFSQFRAKNDDQFVIADRFGAAGQ